MTRSVEIPEACNCAHGQDGYPHSVGCPAYVHVGVRPVESAAIPDAAVKAAWDVFWGPDSTMVMDGRGAHQMRRLLVAARPYLMPSREEIAEALAERWTQPLDLMNRREDWSYPERPMSERIKSEVDASYRSGPPEDSSLVLRAPTCLEIADAVLALLSTSGESGE